MPSTSRIQQRAAIAQYWHSTGFTGTIARAALRTTQFLISVILLGIYGNDLSHFPSSFASTTNTSETTSSQDGIDVPTRTNWIFALVVALLSALTCILHCFLTIKRLGWIFWDLVLCVLYTALAGVFGIVYLGSVAQMDLAATQSVDGMRAGVAFAVLGMACWLVSFVQGVSWCCVSRRVTRRVDEEEEGVEIGRMRKGSEEMDEEDV
ncbi:hypothetical protein E4T43_09286 [Aureobasidium subglaciale]|nr:hypothetical protein E4T43_09286 [Aureobasidium subglaciale]